MNNQADKKAVFLHVIPGIKLISLPLLLQKTLQLNYNRANKQEK